MQPAAETPTLTGVHHLKIPVTDLATSLAWFETALGARRVPAQDHRDHQGRLFAVIVISGARRPAHLPGTGGVHS